MRDAGRELLRSIIEDPNDDELRLIYADWLMDNGDLDRGEFIADSVELARLQKKQMGPHGHGLYVAEGCLVCDRVVALQLKKTEKLRENWVRWSGLAVGGEYQEVYYQFEGGFLKGLRCVLEKWASHGPRIVRNHPIERVEVEGLFRGDDVPDYASRWMYAWRKSPQWPTLDELRDEIAEALHVELNAAVRENEFGDWSFIGHKDKAVSVPIPYAERRTIRKRILDVFSTACLKWAKRQGAGQ